MPEEVTIGDTTAKMYSEMVEFVEVFKQATPERIHTFTAPMLFSAQYSASFVDDAGTVHGYTASVSETEAFRALVDPLYELIQGDENPQGVPEVDGVIRLSQISGEVYRIFETDAPDEPDRVQASYDSWVDAVRQLPLDECVMQYIPKGEEAVLVDVTHGNQHYVTALTGERTLDYAVADLGPIAQQNNMPVYDWLKTLDI